MKGLDRKTLATLESIQRRVLWLATWMVHHANNIRPNPEGTKVGGHQASSASSVSLLTALYFHHLREGDVVALKAHAAPEEQKLVAAGRHVLRGDAADDEKCDRGGNCSSHAVDNSIFTGGGMTPRWRAGPRRFRAGETLRGARRPIEPARLRPETSPATSG